MERCCILAMAALAALLLACPLAAQGNICDLDARREFVPSPSRTDQPTFVRVFGGWAVFSPPQIVGTSVVGNEIRVQLVGSFLGPQAPLPIWEETVSVGLLPSGTYDLYVDVAIDEGTVREIIKVCGPTQQLVLPGAGPSVPALGTGPLVALALTIALGAMWVMRQV